MERHWWYRGRRVLVRSFLRRGGTGRTGRVLDLGCGTGHMGMTLSEFGTVVGVESSPEALAVGRYAGYSQVIQAGSVTDPGFPEGHFHLISLLDVLEHVEDDRVLLGSLAERLATGGRLLVSVPLWPDLFGEEDRLAGHYRRYTPESLAEIAQSAGLEILLSTGYVVALFPVARRQRELVRAGKASPTAELQVPVAPLNAAVSAVAMAEGFVSGTFGLQPGLSLFALMGRSGELPASSVDG
jgi:SAM-dependent methyltransferase